MFAPRRGSVYVMITREVPPCFGAEFDPLLVQQPYLYQTLAASAALWFLTRCTARHRSTLADAQQQDSKHHLDDGIKRRIYVHTTFFREDHADISLPASPDNHCCASAFFLPTFRRFVGKASASSRPKRDWVIIAFPVPCGSGSRVLIGGG